MIKKTTQKQPLKKATFSCFKDVMSHEYFLSIHPKRIILLMHQLISFKSTLNMSDEGLYNLTM